MQQLVELAGLKRGSAGGASRMALATFAIRVGGAALAYLSQIILARLMGAHEYGIYSLAWTWVIVLGIAACAGFSSSPNRFIPEYRKAEDFGRLRGFLTSSRLIALATGAVIALLGIGLIQALDGYIESYYVLPASLVLLALPVFALGGVQDGIARSYDWSSLAMLPTYIWRPLLMLALIVALILAGEPASATTAAAGAVAATVLVAIWQMWRLNSRLSRSVPKVARQGDMPVWLAVSLPMLLVEGFMQLVTSADVIMVSFWHTPDEVAVYFAASKTLALVHFVYFAVRAASAHRFSSFIHANDQAGLEAYVRRTTRWTFWPSVAAGGLLLLAAPLLLSLFGKDFAEGYPVLAILTLGVLSRASVGPADALLTMTGHQKTCAVIYAVAFMSNLALNCLFIPIFGLAGAALATALAVVIEAGSLAFAARRKLGLSIFIFAPAPGSGSAER
ncbi:lipopolysaccharide biosynthesis protein [Roseibium suaedae]|uniref:Membrane protein involved in the export of O-antigen and teichoic acid n=1 Tax=Roseibium suaedae TaxID=735517 RepID=A0A1M7N4Z5_9HYPH|nr:lipopolysaccharide biosynthesis protein [Roseibium suaedae]SHM98054.1 Membrane protein involved in the export of O-antigen and teichoic acid [Roseibium suaedae]